MKAIPLAFLAVMFLSGCAKSASDLVFSGRVEYFYYIDENDSISGFTQFDKGLPGTSTRVKEDVFVEVRKDWVIVKLLNREDASFIIPRERVRSIVVGTKEGNELNIPKRLTTASPSPEA